MKAKLLDLAVIAAGCVAPPAYATACGSAGQTVTCQGLSYQLLETRTANPLVDDMFNADPSPYPVTSSSLDLMFSPIANIARDFANWAPGFKIDWVGSGNYSLVSQTLTPTPVAAPELDPAAATAALTLLAGFLAVLGGRRRTRRRARGFRKTKRFGCAAPAPAAA
jgi:hypothetical protein